MWQHHPEKAHLHVMTKEVNDEFTVLWQQECRTSSIRSFQSWGSVSTLRHTADRVPCSAVLHEDEGRWLGVLGGLFGQLSHATALPPGA